MWKIVLGDNMLINVENLKVEIIRLNKLINNYEENVLNFYNEISYASNYWQDNTFDVLRKSINMEKLQFIDTISELSNIKSIYEEVIKKYERFGNKLDINIGAMDNILRDFDKYLYKVRELIIEYEEIDVNYLGKEKILLSKHLTKLKENEVNMLELKKKLIGYYKMIEEIESKISLIISKSEIKLLQENDINKFI